MQDGFWECHGLQCGFCTPGMIMAAVQLLQRNAKPTRAEIADGLDGQPVPVHRVHAHHRCR